MSRDEWYHFSAITSVLFFGALAVVGPLIVNPRLSVPSQQASETKHAERSHEAKSTQQLVVEACAVPNQAEGYDVQQEKEWNACAQLRSVVATEGQWWISLFALGGLLGTLYLAARANKRSAETLDVQRRTSIVELRPYVHELAIDTHRIFVPENPDEPDSPVIATHYQLLIRWKNSGQTPALSLIAGGNMGVFLAALPADFPFPDARLNLDGASLAPLGPGGNRTIPSELLPIEHLVEAWRGNVRLYGWSWVEYSDDFPGTPRYRSELAFELVVTGDPRTQGAIFSPEILDRFNGMDAECERPAQTRRKTRR